MQAPVGQLAGLLLLVAMISTGMQTGKVHAHVDGDHAHDHVAHAEEAPSGQGHAPALDPSETVVLHAHASSRRCRACPPSPLLDADKDGLVTQAELPKGHPVRFHFSMADKNRDGKLDRGEFDALVKMQ